MITVQLQGGLGNQMFQYAIGRSLATRRNTELALDLNGYRNQHPDDTPRTFELGSFNIKARTDGSYRTFRGENSTKPFIPQLARLLASLNSKTQTVIKEEGFLFDPKVLEAPDGSYLIGYWQTEKYFNDIRSDLLRELLLKNKPHKQNAAMLKKISESAAISLHVRRGDYVTNAHANRFHGTKGLDYYKKAIEMISQKIKTPTFFVFSDDSVWCQKNLKIDYPTAHVTINDANNGYEDMRLMSACRHHIIANSSFSWWGAWLNPNPNKIVIAPEVWFNDLGADTRDIYAEGWIKI